MVELLQDEKYKEYLLKIPKVPRVAKSPSLSPMWVVYVQKEPEGKWQRKSFEKYPDAFKFMKKLLKRGYHDLAINNKRLGFDPPKRYVRIKGKFIQGSDGKERQATKQVDWKPKILGDEEPHQWCRHCRRPSIFQVFSRHHALPTLPEVDSNVRRCSICGASERIAILPHERRF